MNSQTNRYLHFFFIERRRGPHQQNARVGSNGPPSFLTASSDEFPLSPLAPARVPLLALKTHLALSAFFLELTVLLGLLARDKRPFDISRLA